MRAVVQRVLSSSVEVEGNIVGEIDKGLNVLIGVGNEDTTKDVEYLSDKITGLRIFEDSEGKMNLSLLDLIESGQDVGMLVISQFTLYGDCRKGRRPSFAKAELPHKANHLFELFVSLCRDKGIKVSTGQFQANMKVNILNDGPVTLIIDSKKEF